MKSFYDELANVERLLQSDCRSLKGLAQMSGRDPFFFYRGADLSCLDLSGQDLTGLNFEKANFRSSNLDHVTYDAGAFNGSSLPSAYVSLADDFDSYLDDILIPQMKRISLYAQIRPESLENLFSVSRASYGSFSKEAQINQDTLRRARRGDVISHLTLTKIAFTMDSMSQASKAQVNLFQASHSQPMIKFLSLQNDGSYKHVPRKALLEFIEMSCHIDAVRVSAGTTEEELSAYWKERPETLIWLSRFYSNMDFVD